MPRATKSPFSTTVPHLSVYQAILSVLPEPAVLADPSARVLAHNPAAESFFATGSPAGKTLEELLDPAGYENEGRRLGEVVAEALGAAPQAEGRVLVRRHGLAEEDVDRLAYLRRLPDERGVVGALLVLIEGGATREELVRLRAKAREVAHALNNVVMTAVGNISLARIYTQQPGADVTKHLDAAERNLLTVRDITRELQVVAKKDLPTG